MKLVMHTARGVADTISDDDPKFAWWLEHTPPGWSNGYVWVTSEDESVPDQLVLSGDPTTPVSAHLSGQHDQANHGRKRGGRLSAEITKNEGFTYQPISNNSPTSGFAVSPYPERELVVQASELSRQTINDYLDKNAPFVAEDPDRHIGGWFNKKTNRVYLDVVVVKETQEEALAAAVEFNQLAYFNLSTGEEVSTNG
ncbi:MAG: hypothetical protein ABR616_13675 [Dermatophilaceae bacterium]|nr:hypothetical protein [Intrasporangiaceae bacterium]